MIVNGTELTFTPITYRDERQPLPDVLAWRRGVFSIELDTLKPDAFKRSFVGADVQLDPGEWIAIREAFRHAAKTLDEAAWEQIDRDWDVFFWMLHDQVIPADVLAQIRAITLNARPGRPAMAFDLYTILHALPIMLDFDEDWYLSKCKDKPTPAEYIAGVLAGVDSDTEALCTEAMESAEELRADGKSESEVKDELKKLRYPVVAGKTKAEALRITAAFQLPFIIHQVQQYVQDCKAYASQPEPYYDDDDY